MNLDKSAGMRKDQGGIGRLKSCKIFCCLNEEFSLYLVGFHIKIQLRNVIFHLIIFIDVGDLIILQVMFLIANLVLKI